LRPGHPRRGVSPRARPARAELFSALDARGAGFETAVSLAASRAIDIEGSRARALAAMRDAGIELLE